MFLHVFRMSALARTMRKSTENRSERAYRPSRATDRLRKLFFSSSEASKWCPEGSLGRLWALLSGPWGALGRSWRALGRSWGALGALLGRSWALLERSWTLLGALGALLGRSLTPLDDLGSILEPPRVDFGASGDGFWSFQISIFSPNQRARQQRYNSGTSRALGNNDATTSRVGSALCTPRI